MLDTGIVYKHRGDRNKNAQHQNTAKQIMISNNKQPPSPSLLPKTKRSKSAVDASNSFCVPRFGKHYYLLQITLHRPKIITKCHDACYKMLSFHLCITKCCKPYYKYVVITKNSKISYPENDCLMFSLTNLQEASNNLVQTLKKKTKALPTSSVLIAVTQKISIRPHNSINFESIFLENLEEKV